VTTKQTLTRKTGSVTSVATLATSTDIVSFPDAGLLNRTCPPPRCKHQ